MASSPQAEDGDGGDPGPAGPAAASDLRGLVLGWCVWLLVSWLVMLSVEMPAPAVDRMVFAVMTGMLLVWPALRLGQGGGGCQAASVTLGEWLALNMVVQAVIWPLYLIAGWSPAQGLWLVAAVAVWSLLTALVIGWGRMASGAVARTVAMLACVAIVFAEVMLRAVAGLPAGPRWSPIVSLSVLSARPETYDPGDVPVTVVAVGVAAVVGWGLLGLWCLRCGSRRGPRPLC